MQATDKVQRHSSKTIWTTRDILTEPPTVVTIHPDDEWDAERREHEEEIGNYSVSYADIEPTSGWLSDRDSPLTICFMYSFGKCTGGQYNDPRTCHQIHVKREVLERLRRRYVNPQRALFCRTIKANISTQFRNVLSQLARRKLTVQYLEFKLEDVTESAGSLEYEAQYRNWLLDQSPGVVKTFFSPFNLCWEFVMTGRCARDATCPEIHASMTTALTRDRGIFAALQQLPMMYRPTVGSSDGMSSFDTRYNSTPSVSQSNSHTTTPLQSSLQPMHGGSQSPSTIFVPSTMQSMQQTRSPSEQIMDALLTTGNTVSPAMFSALTASMQAGQRPADGQGHPSPLPTLLQPLPGHPMSLQQMTAPVSYYGSGTAFQPDVQQAQVMHRGGFFPSSISQYVSLTPQYDGNAARGAASRQFTPPQASLSMTAASGAAVGSHHGVTSKPSKATSGMSSNGNFDMVQFPQSYVANTGLTSTDPFTLCKPRDNSPVAPSDGLTSASVSAPTSVESMGLAQNQSSIGFAWSPLTSSLSPKDESFIPSLYALDQSGQSASQQQQRMAQMPMIVPHGVMSPGGVPMLNNNNQSPFVLLLSSGQAAAVTAAAPSQAPGGPTMGGMQIHQQLADGSSTNAMSMPSFWLAVQQQQQQQARHSISAQPPSQSIPAAVATPARMVQQ